MYKSADKCVDSRLILRTRSAIKYQSFCITIRLFSSKYSEVMCFDRHFHTYSFSLTCDSPRTESNRERKSDRNVETDWNCKRSVIAVLEPSHHHHHMVDLELYVDLSNN